MKKKIFVFCNCCHAPDWHEAAAVGEDGTYLGGHICSDHCFIPHDMGITSNWKHENYDAHFGKDNWELEWIEQKDLATHEGFQKAKQLAQQQTTKES